MASREERLAQNEVRFREINEMAQPRREEIGGGRFVCECADNSCAAWVTADPERYHEIRADQHLLLIVPGHEVPEVETVVESSEEFAVVRKPDEVGHIVED